MVECRTNTTKREIKSQHAGLPVLEGEKYASICGLEK